MNCAMKRKIIKIDEEKCNGCGACAIACHEGAIGIVKGKAKLLREDFCDGFGDCLPNCPTGAIYTEICLRRNTKMNKIINAGEVFKLAELVPYQNGRIVNMDIVNDSKMKFVVMAFDSGTGLSEHAAPGEALIFALDGEGVIGYEGKDYSIKAGENFRFTKNGRHFVTAIGKFKMPLLLTLE